MTIYDKLEEFAREYRAEEEAIEANHQNSSAKKANDAVGLKLKRATDILDKEQNWLVPDFIPNDSLIVVAGQVGLGKTTACLSLGASITVGRTPIIGGKCSQRNVLMLSNEDSEAQIRRIFERLGGDLSHLYVEDEESGLPWGLGDAPALEAQIVQLNPALVIIDSLTTHKPSKCDLNAHGDVAPVLVAVRKLASKYMCAIVIIHHTNKTQTSDPMAKISGSIGISATARHVILMASHPEDADIRVAAIAKSNLVKPNAPGYKFRLDPFAWEGTTQLRAVDLLQPVDEGSYGTKAETFLREALANGREDSAALARQAESGFGISRRTLQRTANDLGVMKEFAGYGRGRKVYWSLPHVIDDTIGDSGARNVVDAPTPIESPLFDAPSTINDTSSGVVANGVADDTLRTTDGLFETEV